MTMNKFIQRVLGLALAASALLPFHVYGGALGNLPGPNYLGDTIIIDFDSFDSTGQSAVTTGLATGDVKIYKYCGTGYVGNGGALTTKFSNKGITLVDTDGLDVDGRTGYNAIAIDTSDTNNSWQSGCDYIVNIDSVTIDSKTVRMTARFKLDPSVLSFGTITTSSTTSVAKLNGAG